MFKYLKESFRRKKARRITSEYPARVDVFELENYGKVEFANWTNPLAGQQQLDKRMVDFFKQFIKQGDLVIDIGSNIGDTTVPMALCAGRTGTTLAFDPNPYVFKILQVNATLNLDKANIVPLPYAISKEEDEFYYISSEASFGNGAISTTKKSPHGKFIHPEKIKGINLTSFLHNQYADSLNKLSFIKIDTEGYDKEIIKSISDLILKYKPVVVAESFGEANDNDKIELFEVFDRIGYSVFYFEDFDINSKVEELKNKRDILKWKHTVNIYGKPKS